MRVLFTQMVFTVGKLMQTETSIFEKSLEAASVPALLLRAQQGEEAAFKALYEAYKKRVYSVCLAMVQTPKDAQDLTRQVFLRLFRNIGVFKEERDLLAWMDRLTIGLAAGRRRAAGVSPEMRLPASWLLGNLEA